MSFIELMEFRRFFIYGLNALFSISDPFHVDSHFLTRSKNPGFSFTVIKN